MYFVSTKPGPTLLSRFLQAHTQELVSNHKEAVKLGHFGARLEVGGTENVYWHKTYS